MKKTGAGNDKRYMLTVVYWHIVVVNYDLDQPIRH